MFKRTTIMGGVLAALGGTLLVGPAPAFAQTADRVEITGSLIKRIEGEAALPVTVFKADDLARTGVTNAEQIIQLLGQNQSGTVSNSSVGASTGGAAYASLRALGSARTLVLVNGKRVVNNPYQALGVDLNAIPLVALDRIEILTDGASAIYGTDAVAGVVNFIMKREVTGISIDAQLTKPEQKGGGDTKMFQVGGGFGSLNKDGFNVYGGIYWRKFEPLAAPDREFAKTAYIPSRGYNRLSPTTWPANVSQSSAGINSVNPTNPGCAPPFSIFGDGVFGAQSCGFDFVPFINIIPDQEQRSGLVKASLVLGSHTASLEYFRAENEITGIISPTPIGGLTMTSVNPFFPGGANGTPAIAGLNSAAPISIGWRTSEVGGRSSNPQNSTDRLVAQMEGSLAGWDYQASLMQSKATVKNNFVGGYVNRTALQNGLNGVTPAGGGATVFLNPFGAQSAAGLAYLQGIRILGEVQRAKGELNQFAVQASTDVFKMAGGTATIALAADAKKEKASYINNFTLIRQAASSGLELAEDAVGERDTKAVSAEIFLPVMKGLDVSASLRWDSYSDFGSTTHPKVSFKWKAAEQVLLRGSFNTGFRAPTLYELYQPNYVTNTGSRYNDPVLCPGGVANTAAGAVGTRDCNIQMQRQLGGNRNLQPETSTAWTLGFLLQPTAEFSFGADYWTYDLKKQLGAFPDQAVFDNPVRYADRIVRCSAATAAQRAVLQPCQIAGGDPIAFIRNATENLGDVRTSGWDLTATWSGPRSQAGRLNVVYRGTYVDKYEYQREPGGVFFNNNGLYFDGSPVIRYKHNLSLAFERGDWTFGLQQRFTRGYVDCNAQCGIARQFWNNVEDYELWDGSVTYRGIKNLTVTLGMQNMMNVDPPFTNKTNGFQSGFDERYSDALGRTYSVRVSYKF